MKCLVESQSNMELIRNRCTSDISVLLGLDEFKDNLNKVLQKVQNTPLRYKNQKIEINLVYLI